MTDQELKDLIGSLAVDTQALKASQAETGKQIKELQAETDKQIKELGKQIGGLGNKFGSFAEGLLIPTVKRILSEDLGLEQVSERTERSQMVDGNQMYMEVDVFGYANGTNNTACIAEIKSHLREDGIDQLLRQLHDFPIFFRDHAGKRLYGLIAAIDASRELQERVWREGIYLVLMHNDIAELTVPKNFTPKNYGIL